MVGSSVCCPLCPKGMRIFVIPNRYNSLGSMTLNAREMPWDLIDMEIPPRLSKGAVAFFTAWGHGDFSCTCHADRGNVCTNT